MPNSVTAKSFLDAALQSNFTLCSIWSLSLTPQVLFILRALPNHVPECSLPSQSQPPERANPQHLPIQGLNQVSGVSK